MEMAKIIRSGTEEEDARRLRWRGEDASWRWQRSSGAGLKKRTHDNPASRARTARGDGEVHHGHDRKMIHDKT